MFGLSNDSDSKLITIDPKKPLSTVEMRALRHLIRHCNYNGVLRKNSAYTISFSLREPNGRAQTSLYTGQKYKEFFKVTVTEDIKLITPLEVVNGSLGVANSAQTYLDVMEAESQKKGHVSIIPGTVFAVNDEFACITQPIIKIHKKDGTINYGTFGEKLGQGGFGKVLEYIPLKRIAGGFQVGDPLLIPLVYKQVRVGASYQNTFQSVIAEIELLSLHDEMPINWTEIVISDQKKQFVFPMKLKPGQSLASFIDNTENSSFYLTPDTLLLLFKKLAESLKALHNKGIVHKDVKPDNYKVTLFLRTNDQGTQELVTETNGVQSRDLETMLASIVDLGLGKKQDATVNEDRGTWMYLAPEGALKEKNTFKSDVYSLGITFKEMLELLLNINDHSNKYIINEIELLIKQMTRFDQNKRASLDNVINEIETLSCLTQQDLIRRFQFDQTMAEILRGDFNARAAIFTKAGQEAAELGFNFRIAVQRFRTADLENMNIYEEEPYRIFLSYSNYSTLIEKRVGVFDYLETCTSFSNAIDFVERATDVIKLMTQYNQMISIVASLIKQYPDARQELDIFSKKLADINPLKGTRLAIFRFVYESGNLMDQIERKKLELAAPKVQGKVDEQQESSSLTGITSELASFSLSTQPQSPLLRRIGVLANQSGNPGITLPIPQLSVLPRNK